ncbi:MAG TPA: ABC transporter permease [Acidimicrobiales bacterium]|jgi:osmoprotectant transport system permease protein|nr:ABC transporter permease [Acidimicrobiales bacterium]
MNNVVDALQWLTTEDNWWGESGILNRLWEHVQYSFWATLLAAAIALPIGLLIGHTGRGVFVGVNLSGLARAIPTLAVVILVYKLRPLTAWPVVLALTLLAAPPILANTVAGIRGVDPDVRDAAEGMGMTGRTVLWRAELPIALPLVFAGVRSAANQVIATATVAAYAGLGGLGRFITDGYALRRYDEVFGGAILIVALVFVVEGVLALVQRMLVSPGLRRERQPFALLPSRASAPIPELEPLT